MLAPRAYELMVIIDAELDDEVIDATIKRVADLLDQRGATVKSEDRWGRRRFAYEKAGELWMSDVTHGPGVATENGRKKKSYLIALLDDATRVVPFASFALSETNGDSPSWPKS